jgi:hypothetical protein
MSSYIYAVACDDNVIRSISASSIRNAEDKIIDRIRDDYEIEEEFNNYHEFKDYMWDNYEVLGSNPQDIEAL